MWLHTLAQHLPPLVPQGVIQGIHFQLISALGTVKRASILRRVRESRPRPDVYKRQVLCCRIANGKYLRIIAPDIIKPMLMDCLLYTSRCV